MPRTATKPASKNAPLQQALADATAEPDAPDASGTDDLFAPIESVEDYYNFCFYGKEGSGKTSALASAANVAPEGSKILIINAEGGLRLRALQKLGIDTSKILVWPNPNSGEELTRAGLEKIYQRVKADLRKDPNSWFLVGWDSATEVHEKIIGHVANARLKRAEDRGVELTEQDRFFTDRDDYGVMSKMVKDQLRKFRDLPCHFVVTALERRDVDEKSGDVSYGPAITPALQTAVLGYTDCNLAFKQEDETQPFRAASRGAGMYRVKDRVHALPRVLAEPTFERILGYLTGALTEEADPLQGKIAAPKEAKAAVSGRKRKTAKERAAEAAAQKEQDDGDSDTPASADDGEADAATSEDGSEGDA